MADLPAVATILAGFPAGFVALLAPCCFAVLLAAYFTRFTHERDRMVRMTIVFAGGIWLIYVVPTIIMASLAKTLLSYHIWIYKAGGMFMLFLALMLLLGYRVMLPKPVWLTTQGKASQRESASYDYASVFGLGLVSGASMFCCAPVLASVLTLSSAPGSIPVALAAELYFVFGMTLPLFVVAVVADRAALRSRLRDLQKRPVITYRLRKRAVTLTWGDLLASVLYAVFGLAMIFWIEGMGAASSSNLAVNMQTIKITRWLEMYTASWPLWTVIAIPPITISSIYLIAKFRYGKEEPHVEQDEVGDCCNRRIGGRGYGCCDKKHIHDE